MVTQTKQLTTNLGHGGRVLALAFSHNSSYLASGSADNTVKLREVATGKLLHTFKSRSQEVSCLSFSADKNFLLFGGSDNAIQVWELAPNASRLKLYSIDKYDWFVYSPDGRFDGSKKGLEYLHYSDGINAFPLHFQNNPNYTKGLLQQVMNGKN